MSMLVDKELNDPELLLTHYQGQSWLLILYCLSHLIFDCKHVALQHESILAFAVCFPHVATLQTCLTCVAPAKCPPGQ